MQRLPVAFHALMAPVMAASSSSSGIIDSMSSGYATIGTQVCDQANWMSEFSIVYRT